MSLEQEFKKLMDSVYQQIQEKQTAGELSFDEAQELREMVHNRMENPRARAARAWNNSGCSIGDDYYDDDGWTPSMVC